MKRELRYTQDALNDLEELFWFIASDNPARARSYIKDIEQFCQGLCETPNLGTPRADLRKGLRIFPLWRRLIIAYELPEHHVDILRVFTSGMDYEAIMIAE